MAAARPDPLDSYRRKRDFAITAEPSGVPSVTTPGGAKARGKGTAAAATAKPTQADEAASAPRGGLSFVVQKHAASRLHYDFRLELDDVLVSWALPKGPSLDQSVKRMAIRVEDHPLAYGSFEGTIPPGQYGAGHVIVWDAGRWTPEGDARAGLADGKIAFTLQGRKLRGRWELIRTRPREGQEQWLLSKKRDGHVRARAAFDVVDACPDSVLHARGASVPRLPDAAVVPGAVVPGAVPGALPATLSPQLATLATGVPAAGDWNYEVKFDGYRLMARIEGDTVALITRGGHDWTSKLPHLAASIAALGLSGAWLDGEIVVIGEDGPPDFSALQNAFDGPERAFDVVYFVFDLPFIDGQDLRAARLDDRRALLQQRLPVGTSEHVRFSAGFEAAHGAAIETACRMNLEGLIAKRRDAPYVSRRSETWLKIKCRQRQSFVVCGYVDRSDGSPQAGSLLLGVHDPRGTLVPAGNVGTGWSAAEARKLKSLLARIETPGSPFGTPPRDAAKKADNRRGRNMGETRWVEPTQVADVEFAGWTREGSIRHASYVALRSDTPAYEVRRDRATDTRAIEAEHAKQSTHGAVRISHGDRVIDPASGTTKRALVRYYESVAAWILPHLKRRPVSLVRGPHGVDGKLFFQKHGGRVAVPGITELDASLWPGHGSLMTVEDATALVGAAQMNVIEFHTWNSRVRTIDRPDRMVFDLDPGEGLPWQPVLEGAALVRGFLLDLGLQSWLKTSGGNGLHVVVPLVPKADYDAVEAFSRAVVEHLARTVPSRFVAKSGPANRKGKLFVDYLRNGHGATTAAAFSARARPGMGVSMPVDWAELQSLEAGDQWTVATARDRLSFQSSDPWAGYWTHRQTLSRAIRTLAAGAAGQRQRIE